MTRHSAEPRECWLAFRCNDRERQRLTAAAEEAGLSFSDFARERLLAERPDLRVLPQVRVQHDGGARELAYQIRKVGVNLHQLVKHMNIYKAAPPADLGPLLRTIQNLMDRAGRR